MKVTLGWYFKKVRIEGLENVPRNQPLLVAPNHQNAFLDALLVGAFIPIPFHILTRADIFNKWSTPLLGLLNMMPIYRIRDGYAKLSQNDAVFETCKDLFRENESVLIFPEGNHGEHHYLRPLTKGAARIALFSQKEIDTELQVLPVGVNYFDHQKSRKGVVVVFGKPVSVKSFAEQHEEKGAKALLELKEAISDGMKETLVIPEETDDYERKKQFIFQKKNLGLTFNKLRNYDYKSDKKVEKLPRRGRIAKILNPVPFYFIKRIVSNANDPVFHSSLKFATGLVAFPVWWLFILLILSLVVGTPLALFTVFVMVFGLFYSYS